MLITDNLGSWITSSILVFALGAGIGAYKGYGYGEKNAYKTASEKKQANIRDKKEICLILYEQKDNKIYAIPLNNLNNIVEIQNSNLESMVKK